jgi:hypothetical protein
MEDDNEDTLPHTTQPTTQNHAIADTGATDHFMTTAYPLTNRTKATDAITVTMPNGATITSTQTGSLPLPAPINMKAHVLPELSHSLISIGKLCDAGCTATFNAKQVVIAHHKQPVLVGHRQTNGLWTLPIPRPTTSTTTTLERPQHSAHFTVHDALTKDIIRFLHATLFSPTKSTLLKAVQNNHFVGWPGFTEAAIKNISHYNRPPFSATWTNNGKAPDQLKTKHRQQHS